MINVVGALIVKEDKILLAQRFHGELKGKWEFPGGKIEDGETETMAITREIKEELDLEIRAEGIIKVFKHKYPFNEIELSLVKCALKDDRQSIDLKGSHEKFDWVDYNTTTIELAPLDEKIFKYLKENYVI